MLLCATSIRAAYFVVDGIRYNSTGGTTCEVKQLETEKYEGDIVIPATVTYDNVTHNVVGIDERTFYNCPALTSVILPASVTSIEKDAFRDCDNLLLLTINATTLPAFGETTIGGNVVLVPRSALDGYRAALSSRSASSILAIEDEHAFEAVASAEQNMSGLMTALAPSGIREEDNSLWNVLELKVGGTINSYDFMIMRNKMINLQRLDMSEATIVYNDYQHYSGYHSENNILPDYAFYMTKLIECKLPSNIVSIGTYALANCPLQSMEIPNGVTAIGSNAFQDCTSLKHVTLPEGLTTIGSYAFYSTVLSNIIFPNSLKTIGGSAFFYTRLTEVHLPSSIESIGNNAFGAAPLTDVYTYVVEALNIAQNTFRADTYTNATLHIQETAFRNYYYDTQWSQFQTLTSFNAPYEYFYLGKDFTIGEGTARLDGVEDPVTGKVTPPDADMKPGSALIVEGAESQDMDEVHLGNDGEGNSGSFVGEGTQDGDCNININTLHVDISVQANRWYFFAFPFDVPMTNVSYAGSSVWRYYDNEQRANNGNGGWQNIDGDTLKAWKGYIFHGNNTSTLTINFDNVKIDSEDRHVALQRYDAADYHNASWNFVGNPYFNYFDINDLDYEQPITVWNGSSYDTYRKDDDTHVLHPFESFFVQKPDNQDDMLFAAEFRQTKLQSEAKAAALSPQRAAKRAANKERKLINMTISDGKTTDKTRIVFNERSREAYEIACDAAKFIASGVPQLYSIDADNVSYSINERPESNGIVALGYVAATKGEYTISVTRADVNVMLYDKVADKAHYFTNGDYTFTTNAGTFNNRFQVIKTGNNDDATAINGVCTAGDAVIDAVDGMVTISNANGLQTTVAGVNGATVGSITGNGSLKVVPGVYVVTVGNNSKKVMVK